MLKSKNRVNFTKNPNLLIVLTAILTILFLLSFTKSCSSSDKREKVKTALVNQKYKDSINKFELSDSSATIELTKHDNFWTINSIPASSERIEKFINELITIRNLYKISDKISANSTFGLTNGTEFHLRYFTNEGFHELVFGNQDYSLTSRYMMSEKSTQVYEIDDSLDIYLTTSIQSWAEPYLISREIFNSIDIQNISVIYQDSNGQTKKGLISDSQKLLGLRHGEIPSESEFILSEIQNPFIVKSDYYKASSRIFTGYSKISSWTYNKIKEMIL